MLDTTKNALITLDAKVYHYTAQPQSKPPYIVYAEDSYIDLIADGIHTEHAVQGSVDLFTADEGDPLIGSIPQALEIAGVSYYLNSVQYEDETGLIHYEWIITEV